MAANRVIDNHLELANIGTKTHAQIESHIQGIGNYAFPAADGALNQILETDGAGVLSWVNKPAVFACGDLNACNLTDLGTRAHSSLTGIGVSDHHTDHKIASAEDADFKSVNIASGQAYNQNSLPILKAPSSNTLVGIYAGFSISTGVSNVIIGYYAGLFNSLGNQNTFIGSGAGKFNTSGNANMFLGVDAGAVNTTGVGNMFVGAFAGMHNTIGAQNAFIGYNSGYQNVSGSYNTAIGPYAGWSNVTGDSNVYIGYKAGYYETGSSKLFIDNAQRNNEADGRVKALIYGIFAATTANQLFRINGILELTEIKNGATQAGAGASANEVWKTNGHATLPDNVLMIGV